MSRPYSRASHDRTVDLASQVRELFDAKAASWPSKYAPDGRLAGRLTRLSEAVVRHAPAGGSVLDLGCGTGELALAVATSGIRVTGCDISTEMLRIATAADTTGNIDWVELDPRWQVLPFGDETFDTVVVSSVLEYVDDPVVVLRECGRVLRLGGVVLCTVPDLRHPTRWLERMARPVTKAPLPAAIVGRWSRMGRYLTYVRISRQRRSAASWCSVAGHAGLLVVSGLPETDERSPLRLFVFERSTI